MCAAAQELQACRLEKTCGAPEVLQPASCQEAFTTKEAQALRNAADSTLEQ